MARGGTVYNLRVIVEDGVNTMDISSHGFRCFTGDKQTPALFFFNYEAVDDPGGRQGGSPPAHIG